MTNLHLTANGRAQEMILAYLQENASDVLAEKINSGAPFEKDGKTLINKKTLDGFMRYATDEAKKLAEKGANSACVEDAVVYGWAIHYFEEDTIEGKLYNEDGTEYKPIVKTTPSPTFAKPIEPPKPQQRQTSLWDMLDTTKNPVTEQSDDHEPVDITESCTFEEEPEEITETEPTIDEIADALEQAVAEKNAKLPQATIIMDNGKTVDTDTGEVLKDDIEELTEPEMRAFDGDLQEPKEVVDPTETVEQSSFSPSSFDEDTAIYLLKLLDGKMDLA